MTWQQDLLAAEAKGWEHLWSLIERFDRSTWEQGGVCGEWSVKDVLAHIASWQAEVASILERRRAGDTTKLELGDLQVFNERASKRCESLSLNEVLAMSAGARRWYLDEVAVHPDDAPEGRRNLIHMVGAGHHDEHIEIFETALGTRTG